MTINKKILHTENKIKEAFIYLVDRDGINHLKVNDILKYAKINRTTFYKHYANKYDLIKHYEFNIINDVKDSLYKNINIISHSKYEEERKSYIEITVNKIIHYINNNFTMFRIMIGPKGEPTLEAKVKNILIDVIDKYLYDSKGTTRMDKQIPNDYAHEIVVSQIIDIIKFWLKKKYPESPDQIVKIIMNALYLSLYQIINAED